MRTQMYMNSKNKQELYASPVVEVIEVKARQIVCASTIGNFPVFKNDDDSYEF